jgi:hypothetical protein
MDLNLSKMNKYKKGEFVQFDGLPAVVVGIEGENDIPDGHVALWFGEPDAKRESQGGSGNIRPQIWIVPEELCNEGIHPEMKH